MKQQFYLVASACYNLFTQRLNVTTVPAEPTETLRAYMYDLFINPVQ